MEFLFKQLGQPNGKEKEEMRARSRLLGLGVSTFVILTFFANSTMAEYPVKAITMYCVFSPGGTGDTSIRVLAAGAEKILGQPIVVATKDGGTGTVGLALLAVQEPDGYTLAMGTSTGIVRVPLARKVTYKPLVSFTNIYAYAAVASGLMVRLDSPFKTFKDLVEYARENPGKVTYSTVGAGSPMHLIMEIIAMKEKIKWVHVPYKGTAPAEAAAMGGHVDAVSAGDMHNALNGQLRPLLMHTKDPYDRLPDVPTTMQLGYNCYNDTLLAIYGPARMDPAVVKKLEGAFEMAQETPAWKQWIDQFGCVSLSMKSAEYTTFLEEAWDREIEIQKALGLITEPATEPR